MKIIEAREAAAQVLQKVFNLRDGKEKYSSSTPVQIKDIDDARRTYPFCIFSIDGEEGFPAKSKEVTL